MDFEYDGADDFGGRILWGRVALLGAIAVLVFILGRCSGGGGVDASQVTQLQSEVAAAESTIADRDTTISTLQQRVVDLEAEIDALQGGSPITGATEGTEAAQGDGAPVVGAGQVYVVQPGDTLSDIAEAVYNDPLAFGVIASANGITESNPLQVGQELQIPPNPDG